MNWSDIPFTWQYHLFGAITVITSISGIIWCYFDANKEMNTQ